jgi:archaellum component FlaC
MKRMFTKQRAEKFLRKLAGMVDLEDALKKLDRLTQEEARMAHTEVLRLTHNIRDGVKTVDGKVEEVRDKVEDVGDKVGLVGDKVEDIGDKVEDVGDKVEDVGGKVEDVGDKVEDVGDRVEDVGDKVLCVDDKVQLVIDGARRLSGQLLSPSNIYTFRQQASKTSGTGNKIGYSTGGQRRRRNQVFVAS